MPDHSDHFTRDELKCRCGCDQCEMQEEALDHIEDVRHMVDRPMVVTSAYRCDEYAGMVGIGKGDAHNTGWAFDILTNNGRDRWQLVEAAMTTGCTRIGIGPNFVHMDWQPGVPQEVIWDYYPR